MAIVYSTTDTKEVSLVPQVLNLTIYRGDSLDVLFNLKDRNGQGIDLTDYVGLVQFRDNADNVIATPVVTVNYNSVFGSVRLFLEDTSTLVPADYNYDFQLTDPTGKKRTYLAGKVTIIGDISR